MKPDEFMNLKKSHEVQAMSELISSIADYFGIKQVTIVSCFQVLKLLLFFVSFKFPFVPLLSSRES